MGNWDFYPFGELTENFDALRVPIKEGDRVSGPYPYYGASGVIDFVDGYIFDGEYLLIAEDGENLTSRKTPIAFLARGRFWVNNHAHIVRGNRRADTRFLCYALGTADINAYLSGSTMPKLTQTNLARLPIRAPAVAEQRRIAEILGAFDDKIELNRQMNETLEAIARAVFSDWLSVQACPEVARAGDLIAERILGIGDGYRAKNAELASEGLPFARAADVLGTVRVTGDTEHLAPDSVAKAGEKISRVDDVVITTKGTVGRIARVAPTTPQFVYSPQLCYWRSLDTEKLNPTVLFMWIGSAGFREQLNSVSGQTDMAPYVSLKDQRNFRVPRFSESQQLEIAAKLRPLLDRQALNDAESQTLAELRDTLLPKLLSGELRVPEAEEQVASAV